MVIADAMLCSDERVRIRWRGIKWWNDHDAVGSHCFGFDAQAKISHLQPCTDQNRDPSCDSFMTVCHTIALFSLSDRNSPVDPRNEAMYALFDLLAGKGGQRFRSTAAGPRVIITV